MYCEKCGVQHTGKFGSGRFCSRGCANSRTWLDEDRRKKSVSAKQSSLVLNSNQAKRIAKIQLICWYCDKLFERLPCFRHRKFCSRRCRYSDGRFSGTGGYRIGSGRGKSGWYKCYFCHSSYELAYVIYNIDHSVQFKRNWTGFPYTYRDKEHKYYPDFVEGDTFIEVKGFIPNSEVEKERAKRNEFPHKIKIINKEEMKPYIEYVVHKYGKDFIKLYES